MAQSWKRTRWVAPRCGAEGCNRFKTPGRSKCFDCSRQDDANADNGTTTTYGADASGTAQGTDTLTVSAEWLQHRRT